jgi:hypothetical protein
MAFLEKNTTIRVKMYDFHGTLKEIKKMAWSNRNGELKTLSITQSIIEK